MEAREASIRPLPPDVARGSDGNGPTRPWLPAIFAVSGLLVFGLIAGALASSSDPTTTTSTTVNAAVAVPPLALPGETTTTTERVTTTTSPPTLAEIAPGLDRDLTVAVRDPLRGGTAELWWPLGSIAPTRTAHPSRADFFSYDPTGAYAAYVTYTQGGTVLFAGSAQVYQPVALNVYSFAWHPTDEGRIAFIAGQEPGTPQTSRALYTARVDQDGLAEEPNEITRTGDLAVLHGWGEWGYLVADWPDVGERVVVDPVTATPMFVTYSTVYGPGGGIAARAPLSIDQLAPNGTVLAGSTALALEIAGVDVAALGLTVTTVIDGMSLYSAAFEPIESSVTFRTSSYYLLSNDLVVQAGLGGAGTSLTMQPHDGSSVRSTNLPGELVPRRFTGEGSLVVALDPGNRTVVVLDPRTGRAWRVPLDGDSLPLDGFVGPAVE
ncbi:MAG TPA: hypothetical protein VGC47_11260 [Acidimicrobiia bacterium]|jgi:hypothetical protein